jgi:pimeloyl-ACP methyl ester carboxylesterase
MHPSRDLPDPPTIAGVRRRRVTARCVDFHVTEAGPEDGRPVVLLHGWPQHHYAYRHLLGDPPEGLRLIAPDLPGYGWSGPAPHRWEKEEVAADVLALIDELAVSRCLLVGHDWGAFVGFLMTLGEATRFDGFLGLNIAHPWNTLRSAGPHLWRFALYQPLMASFGVPLMRHTPFVERLALTRGATVPGAISPADAEIYAATYRDPVVARTARDTYRTFLLRELPEHARDPDTRRGVVPTRILFGVDDVAVRPEMAAPETANAEDYALERIPECGHFIAEERPDLVRDRLLALAAETADEGPLASRALSPDPG